MTINVSFLQLTGYPIVARAARVCTAREDDKIYTPQEDYEMVLKLIKRGHESVLEHMVFTFEIEGISRACLMELTRHRIASYSVQSTRLSLKKKAKEELMANPMWASKYVVKTGRPYIDFHNEEAVKKAFTCLNAGVPADQAKYSLPETFKTKLIMTLNLRSFRNLLNLRASKKAHAEIEKLAYQMVGALPEEYWPFVQDCLNGDQFIKGD